MQLSGCSDQLCSDNGCNEKIYREYSVDETMQRIASSGHCILEKLTRINGCVRVRSKKKKKN